MKTVFFILIGVTTAVADIWPSWLSPMQGGYDRGNQAISAAVERLTVVAGPLAWTNYIVPEIYSNYFAQWTKCAAAKSMLGAALDTGAYLCATNEDPMTWSSLSRSSLAERLGLDQDWWTNTPRFDLAMQTNGWMFMPAVCSNIVWTGYQTTYMSYGASNAVNLTWYGESTNSLSEAVDEAVASEPIAGPPIGLSLALTTVYTSSDYWFVTLYREYSDLYWNALNSRTSPANANTTNSEAVGYTWFKSATDLSWEGVEIWHPQGDAVATNSWTQWHTWTNARGQITGSMFQFASTNIPTEVNVFETQFQTTGWAEDSDSGAPIWATLFKFNQTSNGFKWFK